MENRTNIVLILKSGGDFAFSDVSLLISHINKYWEEGAVRPDVYCYTDLVSEEQSLVGVTLRPLPEPSYKGWWSKLNLFHPALKELRPFLYLDLDTAILGDLKALLPNENEANQFIALRDFYRPSQFASGFMWIPNTAYMDKVFIEWNKNVEKHIIKYRGDQDFIVSVTFANSYWQDRVPADLVTTFKPNRKWRVEMPFNSSVVCFHGTPRIGEAAKKVEWVNQYISYVI